MTNAETQLLPSKIAREWHDAVKAEYLASGGCADCFGSHCRVTWMTMDGPGYTEYGACLKCCGDSLPCIGVYAHDGYRPFGFMPVEELFRSHAVGKVRAAYEAAREAKAELERTLAEIEEAKRIAKGRTVVVVRGRKVAKGTTGTVIWYADGVYGPRVGLKDDAGTVHFTAAKNVEVAL